SSSPSRALSRARRSNRSVSGNRAGCRLPGLDDRETAAELLQLAFAEPRGFDALPNGLEPCGRLRMSGPFGDSPPDPQRNVDVIAPTFAQALAPPPEPLQAPQPVVRDARDEVGDVERPDQDSVPERAAVGPDVEPARLAADEDGRDAFADRA